jgi:hypothetical protein
MVISTVDLRQNYSPELGHFALDENEDEWQTTRPSSLRIQRRTIQVICGEQHKFLMYLESLDATGCFENFRCPQGLGERFFVS